MHPSRELVIREVPESVSLSIGQLQSCHPEQEFPRKVNSKELDGPNALCVVSQERSRTTGPDADMQESLFISTSQTRITNLPTVQVGVRPRA